MVTYALQIYKYLVAMGFVGEDEGIPLESGKLLGGFRPTNTEGADTESAGTEEQGTETSVPAPAPRRKRGTVVLQEPAPSQKKDKGTAR